MAKRSRSALNNQYVTPPIESVQEQYPAVELGIDPNHQIAYNKVRNLLPSRVIRVVNGHRYEWQPGQVIRVPVEDTEPLRNLKLGSRPCAGCAGIQNANLMFEVSEE